MNMKTLAVLILMGLSYAALAQQGEQQQDPYQGNRQQQPQSSKIAQQCSTILNGVPNNPDGTPGQFPYSDDQVKKCVALRALSNGQIESEPQMASTAKNELVCQKTAGYTLDFDPCVSAVKAMNAVVNAESALLLTQQITTSVKEKNIQEQATKQVAAGDGVTGIFDASIAQNQHLKSMEQQKALAYSGAVAALGSAYMKWPKEEKLTQDRCTASAEQLTHTIPGKGPVTVSPGECQKIALNNAVINTNGRATLALKITEYIAKGVAAGIKMGQFNTRANAVEAARDSLNPEDEDAMFERCQFNPTDPLCATPGNRVSGPSYSGGGDFSLGGGGNNSFDMGSGNDEFGEDGAPSTISDEVVAGTNSPFLEDAKAANDILDPAAAANMQPGSAPGGGGGGVGGGGGGGSASLGNDLEGVDKDGDKDPSVKTSKSSGNYAFGAGGGFQAVKGGKDDKNPFASLFDSKSTGGIEEDRSIASTTDGPGSGLFQRISKRYNEVHAKKRIEANNLE